MILFTCRPITIYGLIIFIGLSIPNVIKNKNEIIFKIEVTVFECKLFKNVTLYDKNAIGIETIIVSRDSNNNTP